MQARDIRLALRPESQAPRNEDRRESDFAPARMDDVVAENVRMFRAEIMDTKTLWLACYFGNSQDQSQWEELRFVVKAEGDELVFELLDTPECGYTDIDKA